MINEVEEHELRDHWGAIARSKLPRGVNTILAIQAFRVKRYPDGSTMKYKARLNAYGGI